MWQHGADRWAGRVGAVTACGLLALSTGISRANLRAPRTIPYAPSSAADLVAEGLTVESEKLAFDCDGRRCHVRAEYLVHAQRSGRIELRFIVPIEAVTIARIAARDGKVQVMEAPALRPVIDRNMAFPFPPAARLPIYQATVVGVVDAGANTLAFEYEQPLGAEEIGHGYSQEGRMVQEFAYALWPIREWRRAASFHIDLSVQMPRASPSWWKRWFGATRDVGCVTTTDFGASKAEVTESRSERAGRLRYDARLTGPVPLRLDCMIGDDDLVRYYNPRRRGHAY